MTMWRERRACTGAWGRRAFARSCLLALALGAGCASAKVASRAEAPQRVPDSVPERNAATAHASGVGDDEGAEERFGFDEAQARRDAQKAEAKAKAKARAGVVDRSGKPPQ